MNLVSGALEYSDNEQTETWLAYYRSKWRPPLQEGTYERDHRKGSVLLYVKRQA